MTSATNRIEISAGAAVAVDVAAGQCIRVVNSFGGQVVDTWAFLASDLREQLSMEHSRSATYRILFKPGDSLVSNRFRAMLRIEADTSPGIHDTLHAACSAASYRFYGHDQTHPNCEDNLRGVMLTRDLELDAIPCPWNLFEHALVAADGSLSDETSAARPGDYVEIRALEPLVVVCSACPSKVGRISGTGPRGAHLELL
ncbi:MAG: aminomethyltransferase [Thiotrichales bacterium]|nr:aminomethyltransferase [Thiotrichales bacterium]